MCGYLIQHSVSKEMEKREFVEQTCCLFRSRGGREGEARRSSCEFRVRAQLRKDLDREDDEGSSATLSSALEFVDADAVEGGEWFVRVWLETHTEKCEDRVILRKNRKESKKELLI